MKLAFRPKVMVGVSLAIGTCALLSACATTPSVTVTYYLPKAQTTVQVVQTVACDSAQTQVFALSVATPATAYLADTTRPQPFLLSDLNHFYADADTTFTLTADGRLATVNSSATGGGEAFVKAAVGALTAVAAVAIPLAKPVQGVPPPKQPDVKDACAKILAAGNDKPLALTYNLDMPISYSTEFGSELPLIPDPPSAALAQDLDPFLPTLSVWVGPKPTAGAIHNAASYDKNKAKSEDAVLLTLPDTGPVEVKVIARTKDRKPPKTVMDGFIVVPLDTTYALPIPRGALFGKRSVNLTLTDSGALTTVGYSATSGAADAASSVSDVLAPLAPKTAGQKAQDAKDLADQIAQQQRLLTCQTSPADCPS